MSTRLINVGPLSPALEARQAMADRVFDNLQRFFADGSLISAAP